MAEMLMRRHISRSRQLIEQQIMLDAQQQG
ncbi:GntR family transcriptional regulator [Vibrio cholerae]|nr:GntR family transcriptional regulator [Vibrio cholerae]